ncbi:hypothetical protein MPSI1_002567 [Malassezia psittaci]|uniref:5-formyltetrahydrofolate cyclo-ligase n=1 Tax=Malassezia psittaci TaxID=1821823 RepID=A0AAF0JED5_9BASI|nr:hypothetical protein MPSI1_002567 [Malassezia psittaci]
MPEFIKARNISIYLSMPTGELDTWMLCRSALRMGKRVYVPRFSTLSAGALASEHHQFTSDMQMLRVHDEHDLDHGLTANKWGIAEPPEPSSNSPREDRGQGLDMIIVPGMLFDTHGGRKVNLHLLFVRERFHAVALALREQVREEPVPTDRTDWPIDALVSPDEQWRFSKPSNGTSS